MRLLVPIALATSCTYSAGVFESPCVPRSGQPVFEVVPELIRDVWLPPGETRLTAAVRRTDCHPPRIEVTSSPDWVEARVGRTVSVGVVEVELDVELEDGESRQGTVVLHDRRDGRVRGEVVLDLRALLLEEVHVGLTEQGCPRSGGSGCDFVGPTGLADAASTHSEGRVRIFVHDDQGERAFYEAAELPGDTWLSAAPDVAVDDVVLACNSNNGRQTVAFRGDNVRMQGVTVSLGRDCGTAFTAWSQQSGEWRESRGHLVENIVGAFVAAEDHDANGLGPVFEVGDDTTVRNSFFWGYHEGEVRLQGTHRVRVVGNTIITFQQPEGDHYSELTFVRADNSLDALVAHNVFVTMSARAPSLARATIGTVGLRLIGNAVEGAEQVIVGLDPLEGSSEVADNRLVETLDLLSPLEPRFLADTDQLSPRGVGIEGVSLDGVEAGAWLVPGAFRRLAEVGGPRPDVVRVGPSPEQCGGESCTTWQEMTHEVQWALWQAWPGGRVELYPAVEPYAGSVVVSWPVTISGMGEHPEDVVLQTLHFSDADGDPLIDQLAVGSGLTIVEGLHRGPVVVENLTVVDPGANAEYGILVEVPAWPAYRQGPPHELRRLRVESQDDRGRTGLGLGGNVLVRDSLVVGQYRSCATFGPRRRDDERTEPTSNWIVNLTCRLEHVEPEGAFLIARGHDSVIVNVVAETALPAPIFWSQRRRINWDPEEFEAQEVGRFTAAASTYVGFSELTHGFVVDQESHRFIDVAQPSAATLFVSDDDSHLVDIGIDQGEDPSKYDPAQIGITAGVAYDGVTRAGRDIDQGCFEDGN